VTETGFVRVSSNARVIPDARPPAEAIELLRRMRELPGHTFWTDSVSPVSPGPTAFDRIVGYRQVTDAHLLSLALDHGGRLATFDRGAAELMPASHDSGHETGVELIP
jgi:hypothetical protein